MKTTIFALTFATIAAMTGVTGASAFGHLSLAQSNTGGALTPVTFYGNGDYFRPSHKTIDEAVTAYRTDRHFTETPNYSRHKGDDWNKRSWHANRSHCRNHPDSWRCQRD